MLNYEASGNSTGPVLFMGSSLGATLRMWENLLPELEPHFRVVRFDTRGHGRSADNEAVPAGEESTRTIAELAKDVIELADELNIDSFHYAGLSLGGAIGQELAVSYPERIQSLILCCTAAKFGEPTPWQDRAARVRAEGMAWLRQPSSDRWFTEGFAESSEFAQVLLDELEGLSADGYANACDAVARFDARDQLAEIKAATLVIAGADDLATPPAVVRILADGIPGARYLEVEGAAHIANAERPDAFAQAIRDFVLG
jgi:3-oxoadipate enol-lactonase